MDPPKTTVEDAFVQFVFDNTDHNVGTLNGKETFHCLGGIAVYTPEYAISHVRGSRKCPQMPTASELASQKSIQTIPCRTFNREAMEGIKFVQTKILGLGKPPVLPSCYAGYLLAKFIDIQKFPSWKGFMEASSDDETYEPSHIVCLPFINEPPSNLTTLNTSLYYAAAESRKLGQKTCFVTYDQPLYWKARSIVAHSTAVDGKLKNTVVRLGFFHTQMSYLGSIGHVMDGSGLEELWSVVYAPESVKKMLSGHAYARAVRAHILTFTALGIMICRSMNLLEEWKTFLRSFFENWNSSEAPPIGDYNAEPIFRKFSENFEQKLNLLEASNPTAELWVPYFRCVTVFLQAIEAQRLGNWRLHLQTNEQMLPLFHAAGHFAYAKSAQIYLRDMANLDIIMDDDEFRKFTTEGFFTIHRTDKAWSGLSSDIVIEQTLNRFFGTDLRHGRGVTPSVVARYLLGMPSAFNIMEALENYCNLRSTTSEQHVDLSNSRMRSDKDDIKRPIFWLNGHNPFEHRPSLTSLSTGIIGGPHINCHIALEKGLQSMESMVGKNAENISLSNVYKVKNLAAAKAGVHINDDKFVGVDTYLLFQRISTVFNGDDKLTRRALMYELSPFPLSLFDENRFMRKSMKSELYKILPIDIRDESILHGSTRVIDGGWLLHHVHWPHSKSYREISGIYLSYIQRNFGSNATVVFDGYNNELIGVKSYERYRRSTDLYNNWIADSYAPNTE